MVRISSNLPLATPRFARSDQQALIERACQNSLQAARIDRQLSKHGLTAHVLQDDDPTGDLYVGAELRRDNEVLQTDALVSGMVRAIPYQGENDLLLALPLAFAHRVVALAGQAGLTFDNLPLELLEQ